MVRDIRVPSSSSSSSVVIASSASYARNGAGWQGRRRPTNGDGLDPDTLFEMSIARIIGFFALKDSFAAQSIHKGSTSLAG